MNNKGLDLSGIDPKQIQAVIGRTDTNKPKPKRKRNRKRYKKSKLIFVMLLMMIIAGVTVLFSYSKEYNVVAYLDGGRFPQTDNLTFTQQSDSYVCTYKKDDIGKSIPCPTRPGYSFKGWTVNGKGDPKPSIILNDEDIKIKANWEEVTSTLVTGKEFNKIIKSLPGYEETTKLVFQKSGELPAYGQDISIEKNRSVIATVEGDSVIITSLGNLYANPDMDDMFKDMSNLQLIDINHLNTKNVKTMHSTFKNDYNLEIIDLSSFDTSGVTDMTEAFYNTNNLSGNITIMNPNLDKYTAAFFNCATNKNAKFEVNYISDETKAIVDKMLKP